MRITYRSHGGNRAYWERRWGDVEADEGRVNLDRYPGKYAEMVMGRIQGRTLEAGCGAGRLLLHYHRAGMPIIGLDFIAAALGKIAKVQPDLPLAAGDVCQLPFASGSFEAVLAFGLYHNLEHGVDQALAETRRVLQPGGWLVISMRADNLENWVVDWMAERGRPKRAATAFHKANYNEVEVRGMLTRAGFRVEAMHHVENMPFLYKMRLFRHARHKQFDETRARAEGYLLSPLGTVLQRFLIRFFPASFCNIYVAICRAP